MSYSCDVGDHKTSVGNIMTTNRSVLIVDPDVASCNSLSQIFDNAGFTVVTSASGRLALLLAVSQKFDAIVSGDRLQDITGLALAKRLCQTRRYKGTPIVLLAGDRCDVRHAESLGITTVAIPCDPEYLVRLVESCSPQPV